MSDFLSKFSKNKYDETIENEKKEAAKSTNKKVEASSDKAGTPNESGSLGALNSNESESSAPLNTSESDSIDAATSKETDSGSDILSNESASAKEAHAVSETYSKESDSADSVPRNIQAQTGDSEENLSAETFTGGKGDSLGAGFEEEAPSSPFSRTSRRDESLEEVEFDPTYRKRKRRNIILAVLGSIVGAVLLYLLYHNMVHVEMEDFVGLPVSEARAWASENDMEMELEQIYSTEYDTNQIISQDIAEGENVRKGSTIHIVGSQGPDPDEMLTLPDFSDMNQREIEAWVEENHASNMSILTEYSDDIEEGQFIRLEFRDSEVTESDYHRRDSATVYVSRGVEVFEKDIEVPDFIGQMRAEVEQWAESNSVEVTYEEDTSNDVEPGAVISQSVSPEEMIAQTDEIEVVVSLGQAIEVPNFANMSMDEAQNHSELAVTMRQEFHSSVSYGRLISQSIEAGTELLGTEDTSVTVVYSVGRPYLKDYHGQLEGDLPRLFYEDYQSRGANIDYTVKTVDSSEPKGTVVGMSKFNEYVSMNYTVEIEISNNALPAAAPPEPEPEPEEPEEPSPESEDNPESDADSEEDEDPEEEESGEENSEDQDELDEEDESEA